MVPVEADMEAGQTADLEMGPTVEEAVGDMRKCIKVRVSCKHQVNRSRLIPVLRSQARVHSL
jgi:hypothetical protein